MYFTPSITPSGGVNRFQNAKLRFLNGQTVVENQNGERTVVSPDVAEELYRHSLYGTITEVFHFQFTMTGNNSPTLHWGEGSPCRDGVSAVFHGNEVLIDLGIVTGIGVWDNQLYTDRVVIGPENAVYQYHAVEDVFRHGGLFTIEKPEGFIGVDRRGVVYGGEITVLPSGSPVDDSIFLTGTAISKHQDVWCWNYEYRRVQNGRLVPTEPPYDDEDEDEDVMSTTPMYISVKNAHKEMIWKLL